MPDFDFRVESAEPIPYAATPQIGFRLHISTNSDLAIHSIMLRCQIMIEVTRRPYNAEEQARMKDLFGEPERWSQTLRTMLWTHAGVVVPPFTGATVVDVPVPCTYDFNIAGTKYFWALEEADVPLSFLFSGTVFYANAMGLLQVGQISWDKEARFALPVQTWKSMMELYYPNTNWICLRRDIFEQLYEYKVKRGIPTWENLMEGLLRT